MASTGVGKLPELEIIFDGMVLKVLPNLTWIVYSDQYMEIAIYRNPFRTEIGNAVATIFLPITHQKVAS